MHSYDIYQQHAKVRWELSDIPWDELQPATVREEEIRIARALAFGESNAIAALHLFLNETQDDYDFSAYASLWSFEEIRHHYAFRTWLERVGQPVDDAKVNAMREAYPNGITHAATIATNLISELSLTHVYSFFAQNLTEPVLKDIFKRLSQDEARHAADFRFYLQRRLKRHPGELASVLETLYVYLSDPERPIKHPVDIFKSSLAGVKDSKDAEMPDDAFAYFLSLNHETTRLDQLRKRIFSSFSGITGRTLTSLYEVRKELAECIA
jgi:hypothetical protein